MGTVCSCKNSKEEFSFEIQNGLGLDEDGITENFQYHEKSIKEKDIQLDFFDAFIRESAGPMHLVKFENFIGELNSLLVDEGTNKIDYNRMYIPFQQFIDHFSLKSDWAAHLSGKNHGLSSLLTLDDNFLVSVEQAK